jgi:glucose-6-phosphate 1-dehydrogenase
MDPNKDSQSIMTELIASRHPHPRDVVAYERVLGDAMAGDPSIFARQDYVEEAWRIVDPILDQTTPVLTYAPGTWGPAEGQKRETPAGGWHDPVVSDENC